MATRLDRLIDLLENGTTPGVRMAAAQQIGAIQAQHPQKLLNLLEKVYKCLHSNSWDARIAASQAIEAIAKQVPIIQDLNADQTSPNPNHKLDSETAPNPQTPKNQWLNFNEFDVDSILSNGRLLLASGGEEFDIQDLDPNIDPLDLLARQKKLMRDRLGLTSQLVEGDFIDESDFITKVDSNPQKVANPIKTPKNITPPLIDMDKLSARERNALKRKNKKGMKTGLTQIKLGNSNNTPPPEPTDTDKTDFGVDITEQPGHDGKVVVEAKLPTKEKFAIIGVNDGEWCFESFCEQISLDLFDPKWEVRHGASLGLRELIKKQGLAAGKRSYLSKEENNTRHQSFLSDICVRILCVLTLDRFGDFVSDQVVAPVRETCTQVLGVIAQYLNPSNLEEIELGLLKLVTRGANKDSPIWEIRHSGLLGLKYVVAVRNCLQENILESIADAALEGLRGSDDDIRCVSASALLPIVSTLAEKLPHKTETILSALWTALSEIDDDLAASTASVMELLSAFCKLDSVSKSIIGSISSQPEISSLFSLNSLLPHLYPFMRHTISSVRLASVQTMATIINMYVKNKAIQTPNEWINGTTMQYLLQNILLETNDSISKSTIDLWCLIIDNFFPNENDFNSVFTEQIISNMLQLVTSPIGLPLNTNILVVFRNKHIHNSRRKLTYSIDSPMIQQDLSLVSYDTIVKCRVSCAQAIAKVASTWQIKSEESGSTSFPNMFVNIISSSLSSNWALSRQIGAIIVEEWISYTCFPISSSKNLLTTQKTSAYENVTKSTFSDYFAFRENISILLSRHATDKSTCTPIPQIFTLIYKNIESSNLEYLYRDIHNPLQSIYQETKALLELFTNLLGVPPNKLPLIPEIDFDMDKSGRKKLVFSLDIASKFIETAYPNLFSKYLHNLSKSDPQHTRIIDSIEKKKNSLLNIISNSRSKQENLNMLVTSSLASTATSLGILPIKLNSIVRPIINSVKLERNKILQSRAAFAAARLIAECHHPPQVDENTLNFIAGIPPSPPKIGPGEKIIMNLVSFICSDPWITPVLQQKSNMKEGIIMIQVVQFLQSRLSLEHKESVSSQGNAYDGAMAAAVTEMNSSKRLNDSQSSSGPKKRARGNAATATNPRGRGKQTAKANGNGRMKKVDLKDNLEKNKTSQVHSHNEKAVLPIGTHISAETISEKDEQDLALQNLFRGSLTSLTYLCRLLGPELFKIVPKLWKSIYQPLQSVFGNIPNWNPQIVHKNDRAPENIAFNISIDIYPIVDNDRITSIDEKMLLNSCTEGQAVIDSFSVLNTLSPLLHQDIQNEVLRNVLYWVVCGLQSQLAAVRHVSAKMVSNICNIITKDAMLVFVKIVLPWLGDTYRVWLRQSVVESIYYIVGKLEESLILPYIPFLIVPVLGRMSDTNKEIRLVGTQCFAQLLKLVPLGMHLESDGNELDIAPELLAQHSRDRSFLAQLTDASRLESYKIPIKINATLRKYQQDGVNWLSFLNKYRLHGILCDDMGLGKTLQTICIIASDHYTRKKEFEESKGLKLDSSPLLSIVICPPTLMAHWEEEIKKYVDCLNPIIYGGPPSERRALVKRIKEYDVVIVSYDVLRNDIEYFSNINYNYCVLDEGHVIKNAKAKLTLAVKQIQARNRLILTGTPVQNNVLELWSLFDYLMPGFLGMERQFNDQYSRPILQSRDPRLPPHIQAQAQAESQRALESLHRQVLPFLLRRMKEDVLADLPPKIIQDRYCNLSEIQTELMEALNNSMHTSKPSFAADTGKQENAQPKPGIHVFQALQYLRRLCNHPALVLTPTHPLYNSITSKLQSEGKTLHDLSVAPKLQTLNQLLLECGIGSNTSSELSELDSNVFDGIQESPGSLNGLGLTSGASASHRALIFCQHREMLDCIQRDLFARHMPSVSFLRLDGTVDARNRQSVVTKFNSDPSIDVLLLTTHVGGLGLNLTGADTVIFVEHDWNPMMDLQAMDRAHRLGQTKVVNVYRLITKNTLEEKVMGLQAFKLNIANSIVNQQNSGLQTMNTNQILDLFNFSAKSDTKSYDHTGKTKVSGDNKPISASKAVETLEELWDPKQYETEYDMASFISSLK
ncbi:hypothetical protein BB559_005174 [Furculomyces boomerangus]|uniref:Uncharacterized protein n=2 Tax=Harpellales TaxID=61421 RepID=A0A2T9YA94_9FUNG|nr:hypothetical protein BB559_005174 [Furculomyces boomerangus]PVZ98982.1 hypothetical protein BB558_005015 [Smittium angustum]